MHSISIIIPYFNRANTIERCLRSIAIGVNSNIEVIIVDDCSAVPIENIGFPAVTITRLESNLGPVAARSLGAAIAKSDYLMFLDSDDELLPGWYETLSSAISVKAGREIYGFPDEKFRTEIDFSLSSLEDYWKWVMLATRASDYLLVIRSDFYRKVVMPRLRIGEVWYIVQLFESGGRAYYSGMPIFRYNQDAGNQVSRKKVRHFDFSDYTRDSLLYSIKVFKRNERIMKKHAANFYHAWLRRFLKECCLTLSAKSLISLVIPGKDVMNGTPGDSV